MSDADFTSRHLVRAAANGDTWAEDQLVDRFQNRLIALASSRLPLELRSRVDPEDVVQSACRVFINRLRNGSVCIEHRGDLWKQLVAVTLNKIRSNIRKHRRAKRSVFAEATQQEDFFLLSREPTPEEACLLLETIEEILSALPKATQRQVVMLRLHGESTNDIAMATGFSCERVRQIIRWVKETLETRIQENASKITTEPTVGDGDGPEDQ